MEIEKSNQNQRDWERNIFNPTEEDNGPSSTSQDDPPDENQNQGESSNNSEPMEDTQDAQNRNNINMLIAEIQKKQEIALSTSY